jgi:hypothetical protein
MQRRLAELPLHGGKAPPWLFARMWRMAGAITMAVVDAYGPAQMLRRLSDPWWFQAFGCVLGFDWHSSGLTTVTCGAMKEAYRHFGRDLGIHVAGGKGGVSRHTPDEIAESSDGAGIADAEKLVYASRMSAKVDSAAVQDGYQLYHHCFMFSEAGQWCVVQQGMNDQTRYARRYHWLGETVNDFVCEPHNAITDLAEAARRPAAGEQLLLNMVAAEAYANRNASVELTAWRPDKLLSELERITAGPTLFAPAAHPVPDSQINADRLKHIVCSLHEQHPADFAALLGAKGVGPATVRSLSLLAELIYDAPASHRDPAQDPAGRGDRKWADYSYAHGGKDGHPFPVDRELYDRNIAILTDAVRKSRIGDSERTDALKRLARYAKEPGLSRGGV